VPATGPTEQHIWTSGTGPGNQDWENPANWNLGRKPDCCHDVVIPAGAQAVGNTLQVDLDATLTTDGTATLTI
jgi:hypothetical protein